MKFWKSTDITVCRLHLCCSPVFSSNSMAINDGIQYYSQLNSTATEMEVLLLNFKVHSFVWHKEVELLLIRMLMKPSNFLLSQIPVPRTLICPVPPTPAVSLSTQLERASAFSLASWTMGGVGRTRCVPTPSGEDATPPDSQDSVRLTQDVRTCLVGCSESQTVYHPLAETSTQPGIQLENTVLT